jgi:Lrp/AsnC family transcriptional regulator, leucine-responsive regulatory protein
VRRVGRQKTKQITPIAIETLRAAETLDGIDWQLLVELQENARLSLSELGRRVGLTPPAVAERVRWLESVGVINGYRLELSVEKLGLPVLAFVRLANRTDASSEIRRVVGSMPEVLECHHVTGEDCYILKVAVPSVQHLEGVLEPLLRFGHTTTSIVISTPVTRRTISRPGE